jgi:hypothetical protein
MQYQIGPGTNRLPRLKGLHKALLKDTDMQAWPPRS